MLPPFIIEQIRQREEKERERRESDRDRERPRMELPVDRYPSRRPPEPEDDEPNRGVVVLDLI